MNRRIKTNYSEPKNLQLRKEVFNILEISGDFDERYILTGSANEQRIDSSLVLSASNLKVDETISSYNSHLVLSSSAGSEVYVSGALHISGSHTFTGSLFLSGGNVGIGTSSPGSLLEIAGNNPQFRITDKVTSTTYHLNTDESTGDLRFVETGVGVRMTIQKTTGNVGIGIGPSSNIVLYTKSDHTARFYRTTSTTNAHLIQVNSDVGGTENNNFVVHADGDVFNTNGTYGQISDIRLKENINTMTGNYTNTIKKIRAVNYSFKKEKASFPTKCGFLAQEIENILPHLVKTNEDGYKSVNLTGFIPLLLKSIQELTERIEKLENSN